MAQTRKILTALAGAALLALAVPCAPAAAEDGVIRVGMTLRMIVENGLKYGQLTRDELLSANASGGIKGHKVEVILLDDECNAQKGVANANRFIEQDKVHLIIGSICSSVTLPLVDITARAQVPQISPTSTARGITEKGSAWIFRAAASERYFAAVHARYLAEHVGKKVAYIYSTDAAGISFVTAYQQFMKDTYGVDPLFAAQGGARAAGNAVTFEPGARTAWHTHPLGQVLIVTAGAGRVQREGGPVEEIRPGDVVWFAPGERHWHGASPTTAMTHIAIQEALDGKAVDWMEHVSDDVYGAAPAATGAV